MRSDLWSTVAKIEGVCLVAVGAGSIYIFFSNASLDGDPVAGARAMIEVQRGSSSPFIVSFVLGNTVLLGCGLYLIFMRRFSRLALFSMAIVLTLSVVFDLLAQLGSPVFIISIGSHAAALVLLLILWATSELPTRGRGSVSE